MGSTSESGYHRVASGSTTPPTADAPWSAAGRPLHPLTRYPNDSIDAGRSICELVARTGDRSHSLDGKDPCRRSRSRIPLPGASDWQRPQPWLCSLRGFRPWVSHGCRTRGHSVDAPWRYRRKKRSSFRWRLRRPGFTSSRKASSHVARHSGSGHAGTGAIDFAHVSPAQHSNSPPPGEHCPCVRCSRHTSLRRWARKRSVRQHRACALAIDPDLSRRHRDLARECRLSASHFARAFRQSTGMGAPSVDREATYRASERAISRRRTRPGTNCSHLWLFRSKPFHPVLQPIRRTQPGKVASAPTQLGSVRDWARNRA
jgi:hypothetical protein